MKNGKNVKAEKLRMMNWKAFLVIICFLGVMPGGITFCQAIQNNFPVLKGVYLGQKEPGKVPELFAAEIMTNDVGYHTPIVFSPDLKEALWIPMTRGEGKAFYSKLENGKWTKPVETDFGLERGILDPVFSVDGKKIFFLSFKPDNPGGPERERIWFVEREKNGWSKPKLIDKTVWEHPTHWSFSSAANGNLYFTSEKPDTKGICIAKYDGKNYSAPDKIFDGSMPYIAPDESYLILVRKNEATKTDLYIAFKKSDGKWTEAMPMGPRVNSDKHDLAPSVSPDGKYLFFISQREKMNGIMWMSADIIEELRPKE